MISGIKKIFSTRKREPDYDHDIILTGLPRSGTTLACKLLSKADNVVGLNEPMGRELFDNPEKALENITDCFISFRQSLLKNGTALARTSGGKVTDNAYSVNDKGERKRKVERTEVHFDKKLSKDFTLVMKHCAEFSLILPKVSSIYKTYALVRNPLAVLGSWNSVNVPVSRGKVAKSGRLNPPFHTSLENMEGLYDKQLFILQWYFDQFIPLKKDRIIRYEDMMASNGHALSTIHTNVLKVEENLESRNKSNLYDHAQIEQLGKMLLQSDGSYWDHYEKADVERLLNEYLTT